MTNKDLAAIKRKRGMHFRDRPKRAPSWLRRMTVILAIVFLETSNSGIGLCQESAAWSDVFRSDAPIAWEKTNSAHDQVFRSNSNGVATNRVVRGFVPSSQGGRQEFDVETWQKRRGRLQILSGVSKKDLSSEQVSVVNPNYAFSVEREKGRENWTLISLIQRDCELPAETWYTSNSDEGDINSEYLDVLRKMQWEGRRADVCPLFGLPWFDLKDLTVTEAKKTSWRDHEAVEIRMSFIDPFVHKPSACIAIFDHRNYWALLHVEYRNEHSSDNQPRQVLIDREYSQDLDGFPLCTSESFTASSDYSAIRPEAGEGRMETTRYAHEDIDPSEFTLSAFGLPEPTWYKASRPWWFYTSILGAALLVLGVVLVRIGKSRPRG